MGKKIKPAQSPSNHSGKEAISVVITDTINTKPVESAKPSRSDWINSCIALLTLFSVIGVFFTIIEMRMDRNAAYKPDILINPIEITFSWDENGWEDWQTFSELAIEGKNEVNSDGSITGQITFPLAFLDKEYFHSFSAANVGVGTAKDVVFTWQEHNTEKLSNFISSKNEAKAEFCTWDQSVVFDYENCLLVMDKELPLEIMYMLPAERSEDTYSVGFPAQYTILIQEAIKNDYLSYTMAENPILFLTITCDDLQEKLITKHFAIFINVEHYSINEDGSGTATYQLIPRYGK